MEQLLNCNFNTGELFCRWKDDPRDQTAVWESMNFGSELGDAACMSPSGEGGQTTKHSARLWSSWLRFTKLTKPTISCLSFVYTIRNVKRREKGNATLALLKHSKGLDISLILYAMVFAESFVITKIPCKEKRRPMRLLNVKHAERG